MSIQIYYLSGTGNSLHVARELQRRLPESTLTPIISVLKDESIEISAETVGLVFPIHNLTVPIPMVRFLQKVNLSKAKYLFAFATRECSDSVFLKIDNLLEIQGKALSAYFSAEMPCTYIPLFTLPSQEAVAKMEAKLQSKLDEVQTVVLNRQIVRNKDIPLVFVLGHILYPLITAYMFKVRFPDMARSFYVDEKCNGCGLCEMVCLAERIKMKDGKPEWMEEIECNYCFACLHYCPVEAVQIRGRKTDLKGRYHHTEVKATDIALQKK